MKITRILCAGLIALILCTSTVYALDVFSIKTAATTPISMESCTISILSGEVLEITAEDLEMRTGLAPDSLQGLTITSLPDPSQGGLFLDGVQVEAYEFLDRDSIDRLCFVPGDGSMGADITFVPQGSDAVTTNLSIQVMETPNLPPVVENMSIDVVENISVQGYVQVYDPEDDPVEIRVLKAPSKGEVLFNGQSFLYTPYTDHTGSDSFNICAIDSHHNYSPAATVEVNIENNYTSLTYTDMAGNPSQYAAIKLHEKGIYTGINVGIQYFFQPSRQMNRGEFLVLLLNAADLDSKITPTVNTGLPNDASLPLWLKPYVKKGIDEGLLSPDLPFVHTEIPIRAEAVVMTDLAANIDDVKEYPLSHIADQSDIPAWARHAYVDLAAYKMLDLYDGSAHPSQALTNSYAADLAWQLWKHCHR